MEGFARNQLQPEHHETKRHIPWKYGVAADAGRAVTVTATHAAVLAAENATSSRSQPRAGWPQGPSSSRLLAAFANKLAYHEAYPPPCPSNRKETESSGKRRSLLERVDDEHRH